ncbi:hypothetical protein [Guptibacillus hwajinpoensis]|uniref:Anti-sigma factor n=1 Tax=Guptibacillus hwajinpoensis TaxID=208199 RepID=A0ABU0JZF9_9BACL|nr:hypothetical protein [Alkalihalobacillus hemicentroti]MDQ0482493.1 hypothetical protein [Alkalihalobacillus hemicentroti]
MDEKLKNLRSKMDGTVLRKGEVSKGDKERIYYKVIHSRPSKRKTKRFVPTLSILTCLLLLLILGTNSFYDYFGTEKIMKMEDFNQTNHPVGDHENKTEKNLENKQTEFDKRKFPNVNYKRIYDYLLEWELPEENRISVEESEVGPIVTFKNGYRFSIKKGYHMGIDTDQIDPEAYDRPVPSENQYIGVAMGYIQSVAYSMENDSILPITTDDKVVEFSGHMTIEGIEMVNVQSKMIMEQMEQAMKYSDKLPALKNEIDKIYTKAETLVIDSAYLEDHSLEKARELEQQYVVLKQSMVNLAGIIDLAREDKMHKES